MSDSIDRHDLAAWVAERIAPIQGERDEAMQRASDWERQADEHYAALIAARAQLADTQAQLETLRANFAAMHEAHALTVRQKRAAEARLEAAEAATQPRPGGPCGDCSHALNRHAAQEGMCLDCKCFGWCPLVSIATPPVDLRAQLADTQSQLDEENIARALWESAGIAPWRQLSEGGREQYRESARRFLAALAASPVAECYVKLPTGQGYQKLTPTTNEETQ